jgi:hypothetical protein
MKHGYFKITLAVVAAGLLAGCLNRELVRIDPRTESYILQEIPVQSNAGVDILVIVDNSGSMAQEQAMLHDAFPLLIKDILDPPIDPVTNQRSHAPVREMHIGVVSTDMGVGGYDVKTCQDNALVGDDGILQHTGRGSGCASSYPDYLPYGPLTAGAEPDSTVVNQLAADFGCIAVLGTDGCGFEQPLEAAHKALYDQSVLGYPNAGFLRPDTILTILFVTDEEDCSAADQTMFDLTGIAYDTNLRCYYNPMKLHMVERYIDDFKALRGGASGGETPWNLVVGFIVGVPPGETACEGPGDQLGGCLDVSAMQERINATGSLLEYVCTYPPGCTPQVNCSSEAFPGRRSVQVAQGLGANAVVQSICTDSFVPAVAALTAKLREALDKIGFHRSLAMEKDPANPCRCVSSCVIVEELSDNRPCPDGKPAYDGNGDTQPDMKLDPVTKQYHTLCQIPQAGAIMTGDCNLPCGSDDVTYSKDPSITGWWYNPYEDDGTGGTSPTVHFEDVMPASGSGVGIQCSSVVCPSERQCGDENSPDSKCCNIDEYCYYPNDNKTVEGLCLLRRDICEEWGSDAWCPGAGPVGTDPLIGGLCCVDQNCDGILDLKDTDSDGLKDTSEYVCQDGCKPRP